MTMKPTVGEPIEIFKEWKNRQRRAAIVISLSSYENHNLFSVREHFTGSDGIMRPTKKGISLTLRRLPKIIQGLTKALEKARELGLLDEETA
jgi:hypothetical protein